MIVLICFFFCFFFFSSRRRHTRCSRDWSSDVCSSDLRRAAARVAFHLREHDARETEPLVKAARDVDGVLAGHRVRSEERRVGKECRSRWAVDHKKKKRKE